jgi:hypothetical protein
MAMTFKYKISKRPDGSEIKTPSIPIKIFGSNISFDTFSLLDSGADISVIPKNLAELLGINIEGEKTSAFGIGGKVECVERKIIIYISKGHENYTLTIPVKVILGNYSFPVLLGRQGFFEEFIIAFDQGLQKITLKKVDKKE